MLSCCVVLRNVTGEYLVMFELPTCVMMTTTMMMMIATAQILCQDVLPVQNYALQCVCVVDVRNLESHLEQSRRRRDEARDPVLHQLRGVVEMLQQRNQSHEPQQARLTTAIDTLQQTTSELASTNDQLEAKILDKINE